MTRNATGVFADSVGTANLSTINDIDSVVLRAAGVMSFDASRVASTATETRGMNTAFAPRIVAF